MLVVQAFLPRFLVLEGLLFFHLIHQGQACNKKQQQKERNVTKNDNDDANREKSSVNDAGATTSCTVDLDQFKAKFLPIFLSESGEMLLPGEPNQLKCQKHLTLYNGSALASCPGAKVAASGKESSRVTCVRGSFSDFEVEGRTVPLADLACSKSIQESVVETTSSSAGRSSCGPAGGEGRWLEIGWRWSRGDLMPQISVCYDGQEGRTHFTNHTIHGYAYDCRMSDSKRPSFKEDQFLRGFSAEEAYKVKNQKGTLESLLGARTTERLYSAKSRFLSRGHLAPDGDFVLKELQDATYHLVNVSPQWQAFNNGNWRAIETAVRNYASSSGAALRVYTGTLGTLEYKDDGDRPVRMFLAKRPGQQTFSAIPVPEFFWKIVYSPVLDQAIVFVGLNDPYASSADVGKTSMICPDVCAKAKWFFFYQSDVAKGFSYCCSYQDFKGVIDWVPDLGNPDVLQNIVVPTT